MGMIQNLDAEQPVAQHEGIMKISIVVTNYNYGEYLNECIDCCLGQTYQNKEIIVVDDGSSDDSKAIILGYGSRIKSIFKSNGGQALWLIALSQVLPYLAAIGL
jgi:cellulose synthase/poly-beta-1,6-N-acetylglucosamine synthase-like glycosyltransferase